MSGRIPKIGGLPPKPGIRADIHGPSAGQPKNVSGRLDWSGVIPSASGAVVQSALKFLNVAALGPVQPLPQVLVEAVGAAVARFGLTGTPAGEKMQADLLRVLEDQAKFIGA